MSWKSRRRLVRVPDFSLDTPDHAKGEREREKEKIYSVLATIFPRSAIKRDTNKEYERA